MGYHIDTGLIIEKFNDSSECPLCQIQKIVEEQFLHEFLNDAVMEDNTRIKVRKTGFCAKHFDMLFARQNKLSLTLQIDTRLEDLQCLFADLKSHGSAKNKAKEIAKKGSTCAVCEFVEDSMIKYYKTVAQMFARESDFIKTLLSTKGFCLHHYGELLKYSNSAGWAIKPYLETLKEVEKKNFERLKKELKVFCDKHDYRNANQPLGNAETALNRMRIKLYGEKLV